MFKHATTANISGDKRGQAVLGKLQAKGPFLQGPEKVSDPLLTVIRNSTPPHFVK